MSDAVIGFVGVFIGGIIGTIATIIGLIYQHKQWKTNLKLERLQNKRKMYIENCENFSTNFHKYAQEGRVDIEKINEHIATDILFRFPKNISEELTEVIRNFTDDGMPASQELRWELLIVLNSHLETVEKEIDELTK